MSSDADERRLDVDLRELRLAVGPQILVAEAPGDLEVPVVARDHEQLLVDLRRLRQRVELARVDAAGHEVVARPFGRGLGENRRLDLEKSAVAQVPARDLHEPVPQHQVLLQLGAPQVEVPVAKAEILGRQVLALGAGHRDGRHRRRAHHASATSTRTSTSPVASSALCIVAGRRTTSPSMRTTVSLPSPAARSHTSLGVRCGSNETWTMPLRSRRSTNTRPPRLRARCTQPPRRTRCPTWVARRLPQRWVLRVVEKSVCIDE